MTRVKRGTTSLKRRHNVLKAVKGYRIGRKSKERQAKEAIMHAGAHAFSHRRDKKGDFRRIWQTKIGAFVRPLGLSYSKFIDKLNKENIKLNRKMLADMAENNTDTLERLVKEIS